MKKDRIWELDVFRGICILGMIGVHIVVDLDIFFGLDLTTPLLFRIVRTGGAVLFILISGACVTLGHHPIRRGLTVLGCGMLFTIVTVNGWALGLAGKDFLVQFGILHLLGTSMLLSPLLSRLSNGWLTALAVLLLGLGYWFMQRRVDVSWLFIFGLASHSFASADWFPLLPNLGWFCLGIVLGRTVYREKRTRLPFPIAQSAPMRALAFCGRKSLVIYVLHQPVLYFFYQLYLWLPVILGAARNIITG